MLIKYTKSEALSLNIRGEIFCMTKYSQLKKGIRNKEKVKNKMQGGNS